MEMLIKGGTVIDPSQYLNERLDILIKAGRISRIDTGIEAPRAQVIDAAGKLVCPGFVDMHVHLREPGQEYKEDILSGSRAAAAGGFTTVCCMANTEPVIDNAAVAVFVRDRAAKIGLVNVLPVGSVTKKLAGKELSEMADLLAAGCTAFSDDGRPISDARVMRNALDYARMFGRPILAHCEESSLAANGAMNEGYYSTLYGLRGIPAAAESIMVARDIELARLTGGHVHFCHVSTAASLALIRAARAEGLMITAEATPHHLVLTDAVVGEYDTSTKVNPPLRSEADVKALRQALVDGTIDCIATDHAPHDFESKDCEYGLAANGISGLETAVAVVMHFLVNKKVISTEDMVRLMANGPAEALGLEQKGTLEAGLDADLTIIDPALTKQVAPDKFFSKGRNTPFAGMRLKGWPVMTIVKGRVIFENGQITG